MPSVAPYQRVAAELRRRIAGGIWPPGTHLPSRAQLAAELGTTDAAVRLGMAVLRRAGELEGSQRSRLVVAHPPAVRTLIDADGDWLYPTGDGGGAGSCLATDDLAARLQVAPRSRLRWERIEHLDPDLRPSHLVTSWWAGQRASTWARAVADAGLHALTTAEGAQLGLAPGVPAWLVQRTRYSASGRPVETADLVLPADRWRVRLG
ncbi:GntR family transcriptional regulator [Kitasatospora indigofera]|uniref:GntR family transcriptional regulator n=1 Tax=Kitasatospora indigofera TaxID=67307 RepID=UPI0036762D90